MAYGGKASAVAAPREASRSRSLREKLRARTFRVSMRHLLFAAFTVVAAVPVITLGAWVEHHAVQQEIDAARDKHLLVAHNLTAAVSRYVFDVRAGFDLAISAFNSGEQAPGLQDLLRSLGFRHICVVDGSTGTVERYMSGLAQNTAARITLKPDLLADIEGELQKGGTVLTDLKFDAQGKPALFLLRRLPGNRLAYGVIGTEYLVQLQRAVAFGARGHAAILDGKGKVIAHPFQKWIDSEFDLSKTAPAQAIIAGETGVMQFYSPAFQADMISAYAAVPETHWGIMVPQPMEEIYAQADAVRRAATTIAFLGLLAAALVSWCLASFIARPLQAIGRAAGTIAQGNLAARAPELPRYMPQELIELSGSFNRMVDELSRTNRELADTVVRAEAASRAKSEFLANMSHEFRTPLNAIIGFSHIMSGQMFGPLGDERYCSYANDIGNSATHLNSVITAILDLSKAEAGVIVPDIAPVALPEIIELTVRLLEQRASEKGIAIRVHLDPVFARRSIDTDRGKLTQILVNLLHNAVKFTEAGGAIRVSAEPYETSVHIAVADTGIGIAAEDVATVMTPFGQVSSAYRSHDGFGLGLPMARKLAEALGGSLILDSTLGEGTTVTVELPLSFSQTGEQMTEAA